MNPSTHFPSPSPGSANSYPSTNECYNDYNSQCVSSDYTSSPGVSDQGAWSQYPETYLASGIQHRYANVSAESAHTAVAMHRSHSLPSSGAYAPAPFPSNEGYSHTAQYAANQQKGLHTAAVVHARMPPSSTFSSALLEESTSYAPTARFHPPAGQGDYPVPSANNSASLATYLDTPPTSSQEILPQPSPDLVPYTRRNTPAPATDATPSTDAMRANNWQCPYCPYVQQSRRSPDLKRHIETHTRGKSVALWVCCGVPAVSARELGVPAEVVRNAPIFDFEGVPMIGGCRKTFSRRDALARHLRMGRERGQCYGDPLSIHQPGNRLAMEEI